MRSRGPLASTLLATLAAACLARPEPSPGAAAHLGVACVLDVDCPRGYRCTGVGGVGSQTEGFCTIPCAPGDSVTCADGYGGEGTPSCETERCLLLCATPGASGECPPWLQCFWEPLRGSGVCVRP